MTQHDPDLSLIFQALSDPTRRSMLLRLGRGVMAVTELAEPTGLRLPTIMRHLEVLEEAHLIETEKQGRTRLCRSVPSTLIYVKDFLDEARSTPQPKTDRLAVFLNRLVPGEEDE